MGTLGKHWKNKPISEEHRRKLSEAKKGITLNLKEQEVIRRKNHGKILGLQRKGIKWSNERRLKFADTKKLSLSHFWKGGITNHNRVIRESIEYKLWRSAVFERDKYTCVWCHQIGGPIHADHIKPFSLFPELRFAIDNGRTLCKSCHMKTETYGIKIIHAYKDKKEVFNNGRKKKT